MIYYVCGNCRLRFEIEDVKYAKTCEQCNECLTREED